ncbi:mitochondrial 37S ribosomal mS29 domain-containing protein [Lipomyces oligophaga]|uniref:mitochondrial 37S ribosomal mS29 domain-containing protein n=1 Tax=Lipomyces oligophaga TaxID=45792 RepID=UPI0034CE10A4
MTSQFLLKARFFVQPTVSELTLGRSSASRPGRRHLSSTAVVEKSFKRRQVWPDWLKAKAGFKIANASAKQKKEHKRILFTPPKNDSWSIYPFKKAIAKLSDKSARGSLKPAGAINLQNLTPAGVQFDAKSGLVEGSLAVYGPGARRDLRKLEAVYENQYFNITSEWATIVRGETIAAIDSILEPVKQQPECKKRLLLTGANGVGKTVVLQQLALAGVQNQLFVIHFPNARRLVDGSVDYEVSDQDPALYDQRMYTSRLLRRLDLVYRDHTSCAIHKAKLHNDIEFTFGRGESINLKAGKSSLFDLIKAGRANRMNSVKAFKALIAELEQSPDVPVLFTVDNLSAFSESYYTEYYSADYKRLRHDSFYFPRLIVQLLAGESALPRYGIIATTQASDTSLTLQHLLENKAPHPYVNPSRERYDAELVRNLISVPILKVSNFSLANTDLYLNYLREAGLITLHADRLQKYLKTRSVLEKLLRVPDLGNLYSAKLVRRATDVAIERSERRNTSTNTDADNDADADATADNVADKAFKLLSAQEGFARATGTDIENRYESDGATIILGKQEVNGFVDLVLDERKSEYWKRLVQTRFLTSGNGNPRSLLKGVLFDLA